LVINTAELRSSKNQLSRLLLFHGGVAVGGFNTPEHRSLLDKLTRLPLINLAVVIFGLYSREHWARHLHPSGSWLNTLGDWTILVRLLNARHLWAKHLGNRVGGGCGRLVQVLGGNEAGMSVTCLTVAWSCQWLLPVKL